MNPTGEYIDEETDIERQKCEGCKDCCFSFCVGLKKCLTFLVSHLGLMTIVVGYCLMGGFIFEKIEKDNELLIKDSIKSMRHDVTDDIWTMTNEVELLKEEEWIRDVDQRMRKFELELITTMRKKGWNGFESHEKVQWTFTGSLFYSIICITTIGYGDQTPKTPIGKVVTVIYAILGIPLMLLFLSNTGHAMASSFRFIYWRICCFLCISSRPPPPQDRIRRRRGRSTRSTAPSRSMSVRSTTSSVITTQPFSNRKSIRRSRRATAWNVGESLAHIPNNVDPESPPTTVSYAIPTITAPSSNSKSDYSNELSNGGIGVRKNASDNDLGVEIICDDDPSNGSTSINRKDEKRDSKRSAKSLALFLPNDNNHQRNPSGDSSSPSSPGHQQFSRGRHRLAGGSFRSTRTIEDEEFDNYNPIEDDYYEEAIGKKDIPLWICSVLLLGYILGGAFLFTKWEKWSFSDSAYFCFITLATIGFGDFVPKAEKEFGPELSITICSLYLLFGMSLLVMTFSLVQQRVVNKVRKIAQRLGIVKTDDVFDFE